MAVRTKNFNIESDIKLACTCGHTKCDERTVSQSLLNRVQLVRDDAMRSLTVTSGGRCQYHYNERKRTTPADHQKGIGIDIAVAGGLERGQIVKLGLKHGFNAIGVAKTFIHLGYRKGEPLVIWTY
ncbi:MAG: hypothetical protein COA78_21315 [Blastopirellula sp.]|nr:hypothetical protein [Colwellia sp.]PHS02463.1 MAG: hypothetical protein COA78_21315 [Blastopirellula sp.]